MKKQLPILYVNDTQAQDQVKYQDLSPRPPPVLTPPTEKLDIVGTGNPLIAPVE